MTAQPDQGAPLHTKEYTPRRQKTMPTAGKWLMVREPHGDYWWSAQMEAGELSSSVISAPSLPLVPLGYGGMVTGSPCM